MRRGLALAALMLAAGCHRPSADQPTPGADGEAQARTAAKTLADLRAADEAARGPAPTIAPVVRSDDAQPEAATPDAAAPAPAAAEDAPASIADDAPSNATDAVP